MTGRRVRRLLSYLLPPTIDTRVNTALADDDLMALADSLYGLDGQRQAEMIAACDLALWQMEQDAP